LNEIYGLLKYLISAVQRDLSYFAYSLARLTFQGLASHARVSLAFQGLSVSAIGDTGWGYRR
jgi:hypothetical protein